MRNDTSCSAIVILALKSFKTRCVQRKIKTRQLPVAWRNNKREKKAKYLTLITHSLCEAIEGDGAVAGNKEVCGDEVSLQVMQDKTHQRED